LQGLTSRLKLNLLTIAICVSMRDTLMDRIMDTLMDRIMDTLMDRIMDTLMDRIMDTLMDRIMQKSVFKGTQLLYSHALKGDL